MNGASGEKYDVSKDENEEIHIYFSDIWRGILKFWWIVLILVLTGALLLFYLCYTNYTPVYEATAIFTVNTQDTSITKNGISTYSFNYNRSSADQLSDTFPYVLKSNILQDIVCAELGLSNMPVKLSASTVTDTNLFTLTASGSDAQLTYDVLLSVMKNYPTIAEYVIGRTELNILTAPTVPETPSNQYSYFKYSAYGACFGLLIGAAIIFAYALFRKTIRTRTDIKTKLNQKCIGVIPSVAFKKYNRQIDRAVTILNPLVGQGFVESVNTLRNTAAYAIGGDKVVMVTSTSPGEGKTTIAVNLAAAFASTGKKVLLIDADLRNPSVENILGDEAQNTPADKKEKGEILHQITENEKFGISFMRFESENKHLWKVIKVDSLRSVIDPLRRQYDLIIIDTSPCGITTDPAIIAEVSDSVVFVIKQDTVLASSISNAFDNLITTGVKVAGCVLNGASSGASGYGENYGYRYGGYGRYGKYSKYYRYGSGYGYGTKRPKTSKAESTNKKS